MTRIAGIAIALLLGASPLLAQDANAPMDATPTPSAGADSAGTAETGNDPSMSEALDDAARSARELGSALMDSARDALSTAESSIAAATEGLRDSMAEGVTVMALSSADDMDALTDWVKREEIVSRDGIDFDRAVAAVDASDYSDARKAAMKAAITSVREAIEQARQGLSDLNTELQGDG
ncbi:MAG: hypothetical protein AAGC86_13410 [Pseudomonadota bacterium]